MKTGIGSIGLLALAGCSLLENKEAPGPESPLPACVTSGVMPDHDGPFRTRADVCASIATSIATDDLDPGLGMGFLSETWLTVEPAYGVALQRFLTNRAYAAPDNLNWMHDARWRLTGDYDGCPPDGVTHGAHPAVRVYYSPEVVRWMCSDRTIELPDGAMLIKEMHPLDAIAVDASTNEMWVPKEYDVAAWTVMVKGKAGSWDGWYWGFFSPDPANPPLVGRSAWGAAMNPPAAPLAPMDDWYPTGWPSPLVQYPNAGFGNYCINCHASATSESTFASINNIIGDEVRFTWSQTPRSGAGARDPHARRLPGAAQPKGDQLPRALANPSTLFTSTFPQLDPVPFSDVWATRFVAESYDHVPSRPVGEPRDQFVTSDQCLACHDGAGDNMIEQRDDMSIVNLSPRAEWRASPMGLAGRDPIFFAQLESETNRAKSEAGLDDKWDCIENTCLHCHAVQGQRQYALDTAENPNDVARCADFLPSTEELRRKAGFGGALFTRDILTSWAGNNPGQAKYGALGRDGISCATCHHISSEDAGAAATFTGNFRVGAADELYGPFDDPKADPMKNALGIEPKKNDVMTTSALCGSCHAIDLPVFDNAGQFVKTSFEQTTYLEWINSDFNPDQPNTRPEQWKSCQDCHMPSSYQGQALEYRIANIEDETYSKPEFRLDDEAITLSKRKYSRHTLFGLNVFMNAFFEQFPVILGLRQNNYVTSLWWSGRGPAVPELITAREAALATAANDTVDVTIDGLSRTGNNVVAMVRVANKSGHNFPSGVGFRRAFIEVIVADSAGNLLWASGRTNGVGVILDGTSERPLPSEMIGTRTSTLVFQPHHQVIDSQAAVQIYEELNLDSDGQITTSFLHRYTVLKDNRLRPKGWLRAGMFARETAPEGDSTLPDADYSGDKLDGSDTTRYEMTLPANAGADLQLRVTVYYQAIPPYYLAQRFARGAAGPASDDTKRLYYLASHLDTAALSEAGDRYIDNWKLAVGRAEAAVGPN